MIPKKIHYCWFGRGEKSAIINFCIASWKRYLPDYEVIEWNEDTFDINSNAFVKEAYSQKKWAFVSDYVRAFALFNMGGIYLDTDVEIRRNLDDFLTHGAFSGFETKGFPFTALWGAQKAHHWPERVLEFYRDRSFNMETNTVSMTRLLQENYGIDSEKDMLQVFDNDIFIYPSNYFCVDIPNFAVHHFEGSWLDKKNNYSFKRHVFVKFINDSFITQNDTVEKSWNVLSKAFRLDREVILRLLKKSIKRIFK